MTNNRLSYRNYTASIEFSAEDALLVGRVEDIEALILFSGASVPEVTQEFHHAIDDYIVACEAQQVEPEKAFKGSFNVRVGPELHRKAAMAARRRNRSLNELVRAAIEAEVERSSAAAPSELVMHSVQLIEGGTLFNRNSAFTDPSEVMLKIYERAATTSERPWDDLPLGSFRQFATAKGH